MGVSKGDKENLLNLYVTLLNKVAIEDVISEKVEGLKWEFYYEGKMIDIYGTTESGKYLFVEHQITFADERHLDSIKEVINRVPNNSIVLWGALGFSTDMMKAISTLIHQVKDKKIEFFAVEINLNVLPILEKLNNMHVLQVIDNLKLLDTFETYNDLFDKYVSGYEGNLDTIQYRFEKITDRERTNSYIINELRSKVKYPNIYREKRTTDINKIRYGAGRTGIDYELVFSDRKGDSFVSCQFSSSTEDIYREMVKRKNSLENKIGRNVLCDDANLRLITYVNSYEHKFDRIDQLVDLMEKFIFYLSNYTFYLDKPIQDEMWEQHKDGVLVS